MKIWLVFTVIFGILLKDELIFGSVGDASTFYINCRKGCRFQNCTEGKLYVNHV